MDPVLAEGLIRMVLSRGAGEQTSQQWACPKGLRYKNTRSWLRFLIFNEKRVGCRAGLQQQESWCQCSFSLTEGRRTNPPPRLPSHKPAPRRAAAPSPLTRSPRVGFAWAPSPRRARGVPTRGGAAPPPCWPRPGPVPSRQGASLPRPALLRRCLLRSSCPRPPGPGAPSSAAADWGGLSGAAAMPASPPRRGTAGPPRGSGLRSTVS